MICLAMLQPMAVMGEAISHSDFCVKTDGAGACYRRKLLQNPIDIFLEESKRIPFVKRVALFAPGSLRHSNEFLLSGKP
jgi:hypothetical protein